MLYKNRIVLVEKKTFSLTLLKPGFCPQGNDFNKSGLGLNKKYFFAALNKFLFLPCKK